ncbi:MAG: hypothetical protein PHW98_02390 [Candidatus Omnitrophica bacterium]|nr:hypothetical protein [Candidatus Omnitrophota bacterium]
MSRFFDLVEDICRSDKRYKPDAYEFVLQGLNFTQERLKKRSHISGKELAVGLRDYAVERYGGLAQTVLSYWGISSTGDYGQIVYNMIGRKLLAKSDEDRLSDFESVYDFDEAFANVLSETIDFNIADKP